MTVDQIIEENRELQLQYTKALNTIATLERKVVKLQKENVMLKEQNKKLQKQNNILMRAIEIAIQIRDYNAQTRHLKKVLEKIREETGEFKG
ncbi:cell division protein ZapB [Sulfurisphaera ohwakuensis]|uniref:Cell division protein ZapB n=1 Tax=Sulfurisphaera ohwakuensis TaxID=69656 RepID=A0A650CDQ8_SULOH|nr:cell division protein ZapB [Sulfurisphaera ohwakuensis]MBB5253307.1 regulator of replication initiation timing [Sulfurisphaera ohwakuensis]QGR15795.1 cell division protein ZapB [Sulfurisphaera ohwakuensis]